MKTTKRKTKQVKTNTITKLRKKLNEMGVLCDRRLLDFSIPNTGNGVVIPIEELKRQKKIDANVPIAKTAISTKGKML